MFSDLTSIIVHLLYSITTTKVNAKIWEVTMKRIILTGGGTAGHVTPIFFRRHAEGNGSASPAVAAVHHFSRHDTSPFRSFSNLSAISLCLDGKRCA